MTAAASPPADLAPGVVRLPGLKSDMRYALRQLEAGTELSGRVLGEVGIQPPPLLPEQAALLHLAAVAPAVPSTGGPPNRADEQP